MVNKAAKVVMNDSRKCDPFICSDESLTKQSFAEECDVNEILRRAQNGQDISGSLNQRVGQYGDFTNIPSYHEAMDLVVRANNAFMELDWKLRERFQNDPERFIAFVQDDANYDEAVKLGLISAKPKPNEASASAGVPAKPANEGVGAPAAQ